MDKTFEDLLQGPDYVTTNFSDTVAKAKGALRPIEYILDAAIIPIARINGYLPTKQTQRQETFAQQGIPEYIPLTLAEQVRVLSERTPDEKAWDNALLIDIRGPAYQRRLTLREPVPRFTRTRERLQEVKAVAAKVGGIAMRGPSTKSW